MIISLQIKFLFPYEVVEENVFLYPRRELEYQPSLHPKIYA